MKYFGTSLDSAGHFFWNLERGYIEGMNLDFSKYPFNPEGLMSSYEPKGQSRFYQIGNYTILAICGAPKDNRPGSKSVFFLNEVITKDKMIEKIKGIPIAMEIISKIPSEKKWDE